MSPRIPDTHAEAWALLPWLANGRIGPAEREWVDAHVQTCAECRAELAAQRMVANQMHKAGAAAPEAESSDEQRSFNKLWSRIEAAESVSLPVATGSRATVAPRLRAVRWLAAAVIVQAIGLGILGMTAFRGESRGADDFRTVTSAPAARPLAPSVRVVFAPDASMATVNTLLTHQGLEIVAGPGTSGNFTAQLSADAVASGATAESVAAVISKDPNVSFAQPVAR